MHVVVRDPELLGGAYAEVSVSLELIADRPDTVNDGGHRPEWLTHRYMRSKGGRQPASIGTPGCWPMGTPCPVQFGDRFIAARMTLAWRDERSTSGC